MKNNTKVCVVGLGYIGLPTAALLANSGYKVIGVDTSLSVVSVINDGKVHIIEPDLDISVRNAVHAGNLLAKTKPAEADVFMICVPTPFIDGGIDLVPQPDLSYVQEAAKEIAPFIRPGNIVILESTSPVGTTKLVGDILKNNGVNLDEIYLSYCPERVLPGRIMVELIENDRVIGGLNSNSTAMTAKFYKTFIKGDVLETNAQTAEMCKLVENSSRDVGIAFANEISMLCDQLNIDVNELIKLANHHPRVNILQPGCGVGGHCIAVDPWFIVAKDPQNSRLIRVAREVNNYKTYWVIEKIKNVALDFQIKYGRPPRIACMGVTFKPNIDDLRESPALAIAKNLYDQNYDLVIVEPNIDSCESLNLVSIDDAINHSDILVFLVMHKEFLGMNTRGKCVLDFCASKV